MFNPAGIEVSPELSQVNVNALGGFNPTRNLEEYNTGGSHEENPYGGIPIGNNSQGIPATVEDGETSFDIGDGAKRILTDKKKVQGKNVTYAVDSKRIENKYKDRKGDPISEDQMTEFYIQMDEIDKQW